MRNKEFQVEEKLNLLLNQLNVVSTIWVMFIGPDCQIGMKFVDVSQHQIVRYCIEVQLQPSLIYLSDFYIVTIG